MVSVNISQLKDRLSHYLRLAKSGTTVRILDHGIPVATIRSAAEAPGVDALARLSRDGLVAPSEGDAREALSWTPLPVSADAAELIADERSER